MKARYRALSARASAVLTPRRPLVMTGRSIVRHLRHRRRPLLRRRADSRRRRPLRLGRQHRGRARARSISRPRLARRERRHLDQRRRLAQSRGDGRGRAALRASSRPTGRARSGSTSAGSRPTGGNDYWSRSVSRPDLVLADLVKIFHPGLLPAHVFEWYMPVPGATSVNAHVRTRSGGRSTRRRRHRRLGHARGDRAGRLLAVVRPGLSAVARARVHARAGEPCRRVLGQLITGSAADADVTGIVVARCGCRGRSRRCWPARRSASPACRCRRSSATRWPIRSRSASRRAPASASRWSCSVPAWARPPRSARPPACAATP